MGGGLHLELEISVTRELREEAKVQIDKVFRTPKPGQKRRFPFPVDRRHLTHKHTQSAARSHAGERQKIDERVSYTKSPPPADFPIKLRSEFAGAGEESKRKRSEPTNGRPE